MSTCKKVRQPLRVVSVDVCYCALVLCRMAYLCLMWQEVYDVQVLVGSGLLGCVMSEQRGVLSELFGSEAVLRWGCRW